MEPDVHVASYNVGLTNPQVDPESSGIHFFKFTKELRSVIHRMLTCGADTPTLDARSAGSDTSSTSAHAVFLCEMGSQRRNEPIDDAFQKRAKAGFPLATEQCITIWDSATRRATSLHTCVKSCARLVSTQTDTSCGQTLHTQ